MKYKDHHTRVTLAVTSTIEQVPKEQEVAHGATTNLDAGKTPCWAGATPLLHTVPWPKVMLGVAPAHEEIPPHVLPECADEFLDETYVGKG